MKNENNFLIREVNLDDSDSFIDLFNYIDEFHRKNVPTVFQKPSPDYGKLFLEETLKDTRSKIFIAENKGKIVGYVYIAVRENPKHPIIQPGLFINVEQLVTHPSKKRHGVGTSLMRYVEQFARDLNISDIRLNVWNFNTDAERFYEQIGYQPIRTFYQKRIQ